MMCPKCGSENPDGAAFCEKCGQRLTAGPGTPGGPMAAPRPMGPPIAADHTVLIVVIVVAIVAALIVVGSLFVVNAFHQATTWTYTMSVLGTKTPTSSEYAIGPSAGMTYIQVNVSLTNKGDLPALVSSSYFTLQAGGVRYIPTNNVSTDSVETTLASGATLTFKVSFEMPLSSLPQRITFAPVLGGAVSAPIYPPIT